MKKLAAFLFVALMVLSFVPVATSAASGVELIAEYNFDAQTTADSVGSHNATLYNSASTAVGRYTDGISGKALQLSTKGTNEKYWLSVPYSVFDGTTDSFSLSMWYKASDYNTSGEASELFSFYNSSAEKFLFYSPASVDFQDKAFTMKWDGTYGYANVMTAYAPNEWVHLVFCVEGKNGQSYITSYVNGRPVETDQGGAWANSLMSTLGINTFTIGGKNPYKGGSTPACLFYGAVDEVKIYSGVLTENEAHAIYSEHMLDNEGGIFFRPTDAGTGDVTPIYYNGEYYIFYLDSVLHKWCYVTTKDFAEYSSITVLQNFGGTGDVLNVNGTWHLFASKVENGSEVIHHYSGTELTNLTDTGKTIRANGITFARFAWRDPRVWYDETIGKYRMIVCAWRFDGDGVERDGCVASLTSSDLNNWTLTGQYYSSSYFTGSYECPDHFKMGDWYYLVFSNCSYGKQTYYVKSQSPNGPWQIPLNDTFDSRFFYAAKTVSDGDNRYIIGWAGDRDGEVTIPDTDVNVENTDDLAMIGYAGNMVVHQLEQTEDGDLIAVPAQCITSQFTAPMANTLTPKTGSWQKGADYAKVTADNSCATLLMQNMPEQFMLTFKLKTTAKQAGIVLGTDAKFAYNGYYIIFDRLYSRLRESTGALSGVYGYYFPYDSELERPLTFVQGKTYDVTVLCEGQIAVIYVDGECALTVRMTQEDRGKLGLFCYAGSAEFTDIQMYSYERDELADRLLAAYSFDTQTTQDDIGNNDATFYNNATAGTGVYTDGVSGKALQLSTKGTGQKYWLSVPYAAFADSRDSFTLSMWYKATDRNTSGEDSELFSLYNSSAEKFLFYAPALTGNANMGYSMKWDSTYGYVNVPYAQRVDEWTNLVYVVSDSGGQTQISVYINGTQISVDRGGAWANSLMSQLGIDTFTIGGKNPYKGGATPSCLFYGAVDEIKLYAGALTATEVTALYGGGHIHSYTEQIVPPTCTAQGYTLHFCSCGHSFKDNYTAIVEHNYIPGTIVAPSCASEGYTINTCSGCGDVIHTNVTSALEHSYAAPVDTDSSVHTFTCLVCGQTFTEAHDYENGVCICGREQLKIASAYLRLDQDIDVIYTAEIPTNAVDPYMTFTLCDMVYTVRDYTVNSNGQYCFEFCGLRPQFMNENICAVLHATVNSVEETDTLAQYSVREYCENTLARYSQNENLVTLLSDLLTYGAAAQTYVGYKTDALVTSGLDLTPSTFTSAEGIAISFAGERDDAADWTSAALALSNDLAMRFAFTAESVDGLSVEVSINGRTETFTEFETAGEGKYVVVFRGIKATEFDDAVTASFKLNGTPIGRSVTYSVNTYICGTQNNTETQNLAQLVRALYNYGAAAEAYTAAADE